MNVYARIHLPRFTKQHRKKPKEHTQNMQTVFITSKKANIRNEQKKHQKQQHQYNVNELS